MSLRLAANIIALCGTGAFAGLMLNIGLTFGAYWKGLPPAAFLDWFSTNGHLIGRTIPVVLVPAIIGICASIWLAPPAPGTRLFWLASLAAIALILAVTMLYHLPTNARFAARTVALDQVGATLDRWLWLHWVRIVLGFAATIAGVMAIAR